MDAIAGLLDGPRARQAFLLRASMDPPWSIRVVDEAPLTVVAVVRGEAWMAPDGGEARLLRAGDVAVARGPDHYRVADALQTPETIVIHPGGHCRSLDGAELMESMRLGIRSWGNAADGAMVMLVGTYQLEGEVSARLLRALPPLLTLRSDEWDCPVIPLLADEMVKDEPGQEAVLDRLLDLLLIAALRAWLARPDAGAPEWYRAASDPVVGHALRLLHAEPAAPWTVSSLAERTGVSRSTLAKRFADLVGEPPLAYLTRWRMTLAADLLVERADATVAEVARAVGYSEPFGFSAAFKRVRGANPSEFRRTATATVDAQSHSATALKLG